MTRLFSLTLLLALIPTPLLAERAIVGGPTHPNGTEVVCDLPSEEHLRNKGGIDGLGLCVFCSIAHCGRWQNIPETRDFLQVMLKERGGGWPEKVDRMMQKYAPGVLYLQYEGNSEEFLDLAMKTGRMVCITYNYSERYGGRIAHMVNVIHLDQNTGSILDNNYPNTYEHMSRQELMRRAKLGQGHYWAIVFLASPPSPIPVN